MDIGLVLPDHGPWEYVVELASKAERLGVGSLWLSDPSGDGRTRSADGVLEPLVALAALARLTSTARLGVLLQAGARRPAVAAKALSTIDVLSGGRVIVGLEQPPGVGPADTEALQETVQVMRGAFGGGPFTFRGRHHHCEGLRCRPLPLQRPAPPIWVSGGDESLVSLAARHADGWGPSRGACGVEEYRGLAEVLDHECEAAGRDPADIDRFVRRDLGDVQDERERIGEELAQWGRIGVATLLLDRRGVALPATSVVALEEELEIVESAVSSAT